MPGARACAAATAANLPQAGDQQSRPKLSAGEELGDIRAPLRSMILTAVRSKAAF